MRCCSVPSAGLELGLILFLGFRAAIQDEGSRFPRSAARRECPLCLGFPGRLQRRTAPRGGSVGLALRRETSAPASDQKLSLAQRSLWNPESWVPHWELGFQPVTQDVATLENLGTHGTDPRRERDLDAETGQHRSTQHMCAHVYTHTQNIWSIDPTHREDALGKETAHGEAHIHIYQRPHTQRRAHTPPGDPTRRKSTTDTQYHSNRDPTHTENRTTDIHHRCKQGTQHTANTIHTPHTDLIHGEAYHITTTHIT